jgi:hypothetical protein
MATATRQRRGTTKPASERNGTGSRVAAEFVPGSLEADLSAIGKSVPVKEWAKIPADYFANLDHYRHGAPKKK